MGPDPVSLWDLTRLGVCSLGGSLNSALQTSPLMEGAARADLGLQISFSEEVRSLVQGPRRARVVQQGDERGKWPEPPLTAPVPLPQRAFRQDGQHHLLPQRRRRQRECCPDPCWWGRAAGSQLTSHPPRPRSPTPTCLRYATRTGSSSSMTRRRTRKRARVRGGLMERMVPGRAASWPGGPAWASPRVCGEYPPAGSPAQRGHRAHVKWFSSAGVSEKNKGECSVCIIWGAFNCE